MALEAVLGHKTPCTTSLCFSAWHARILIRLMSPRIEISVHQHQWFQAHPGNQGAMHTSQSELCLTLVWMLAKNVMVATVLKICSFTGLSPSSYVWLDREVCAGTDLYRPYACFSPASKGSATPSQSKHWSGGCRVCRTCSATPVIGTTLHQRLYIE